MQVVLSTPLAFLVIIALAMKGPFRGLWVFMATTPFGVAAAFNLPAAGGASIMVTDLAAMAAFTMLWLEPYSTSRLLGTMRPFQPGFYLILLILFSAVSAILFPRLFAGQTEVFGIDRSANTSGIISVGLHATTGNLTQLFRILLDGFTFFTLATVFREAPDTPTVVRAMAVAAFVNVALGWLDVITGMVGAGILMEPIRTANYAILADVAMAGLKRMIGGFSEASSFGYYTLGMFGFWLVYWIRATPSRLAGWALAMTALVLLRSTSSSAYVSMAVFLVTLAAIAVARDLGRSVERRMLALVIWGAVGAWLAVLAVGAGYALTDSVKAFLDRALFDKLDTASGIERMSWNVRAFQNFTDTALMGAGLGSMRASNWLLACLGSIGVIGTGLYLAFLGTMLGAPAPRDDRDRAAAIAGLQAGCLAMFISAMLTQPTPDLGIIFFAMAGLAVGLSRGAVVESLAPTRPMDWFRSAL
ncbi:MAG: hypothetical protein GC186_18980 [Rhodobacteraceae bacterium]|nr:hypothetical protein [Paracoccaceae bacterium]